MFLTPFWDQSSFLDEIKDAAHPQEIRKGQQVTIQGERPVPEYLPRNSNVHIC